jgi:hypothetical protein
MIEKKRKKAQVVNASTVTGGISKDCTYLDAMTNEAFRFFPGKEEWRKRLIFSMFKWLEDTEAILFEDFLFEYKIPHMTFYAWMHEYPDIKKSYTELCIQIAGRRKKGAMKFELHVGAVMRDIHLYDPKWGPMVDQYHVGLKNQEDKSHGNVTVLLEKYTDDKDDKE